VVHDQWSADTLNRVFKGELGGQWSMQTEEEAQPEIKPASRRRALDAGPESATPEGAPPEAGPPADPGAPHRRKHTRYKVRFWVVITYGIQTFNSATRDVSAGGICLE